MLVGLKSFGLTGCRPVDEDLLRHQRHFVTAFRERRKPDLEGITVELSPKISKQALR